MSEMKIVISLIKSDIGSACDAIYSEIMEANIRLEYYKLELKHKDHEESESFQIESIENVEDEIKDLKAKKKVYESIHKKLEKYLD